VRQGGEGREGKERGKEGGNEEKRRRVGDLKIVAYV